MPFPTVSRIESPRLVLRPVAVPTCPLCWRSTAIRRSRGTAHAAWQSLADAEVGSARMEAMAAAGTGQVFALERRADAKVVGASLLFKYEEGSARVELGYVLGRAAWGQGLMREAVAAGLATRPSASSVFAASKPR
jgi:RimJ/RimL family protein N-acetyltransferase